MFLEALTRNFVPSELGISFIRTYSTIGVVQGFGGPQR